MLPEEPEGPRSCASSASSSSGFTESPEAYPTLLEALDDKSALVRAEACRSLEDLRATPRPSPHLEARLDDVDEEVRVAAAEALLAVRGGGGNRETG